MREFDVSRQMAPDSHHNLRCFRLGSTSAKSHQFMARPKWDLCHDPNQEIISVGTGINPGKNFAAKDLHLTVAFRV